MTLKERKQLLLEELKRIQIRQYQIAGQLELIEILEKEKLNKGRKKIRIKK